MELPSGPRYPLGVYDHPHDPEVPFLRSVAVGDGFLASTAEKATRAISDVEKWLDDLIPGL